MDISRKAFLILLYEEDNRRHAEYFLGIVKIQSISHLPDRPPNLAVLYQAKLCNHFIVWSVLSLKFTARKYLESTFSYDIREFRKTSGSTDCGKDIKSFGCNWIEKINNIIKIFFNMWRFKAQWIENCLLHVFFVLVFAISLGFLSIGNLGMIVSKNCQVSLILLRRLPWSV